MQRILTRSLILAVGWGLLSTFSLNAQTLTTIQSTGSPSNRVDIILIGDGYRDVEAQLFAQDAEMMRDYFFMAGITPLPRYEKFFNFHRIFVESNESGADDPNMNIFVDTALNASYNIGGIDRCLYFNTGLANSAMNAALAGTGIDPDIRLGAVNSDKYGGCGGLWGVYAASNMSALDIAIHEMGHSFADLADEYFSPGTWTGGEVGEVNATSNPQFGKWDRWIGYDDPNSNIGVIGYYEGCRYFQNGLFRPSQNSEMRSLFRPFDAISREQLIQRIYDEVDPLDSWSSTQTTYGNGDTLFVEPVDTDVIVVEWSVDGVSQGLLGSSVAIESLDLAAGTHQVTARGYDEILDHAFTGDSLDLWRKADTSDLEQSVTWLVEIADVLMGDVNEDGVVNLLDVGPFVELIANGDFQLEADINGDGSVDLLDVGGFVLLLQGA